jgi:16S rRNA (adenine1518-N6/adenine1519-N6)-dimethyltransferase
MELSKVKPKKELGQHFLTDQGIALRIAQSAEGLPIDRLVEIGPGMGILTKPLLEQWRHKLALVEIDAESVNWLKKQDWTQDIEIIQGDFLKLPEESLFINGSNAVIGNYPYNISTQIAFKVLESPSKIVFFGGMFQKEVARRFCSPHGNKEYGITSVLLQAFYECKYLFTVNEGSFNPPPAVKSGVIACVLKDNRPECRFKSLSLVVKTAFNQRRKTLSNSLKSLKGIKPGFEIPAEFAGKRAEQLSVDDFVRMAVSWEKV